MKQLVLMLLLTLFAAASAQRQSGTLVFGGETRRYTQFVPETHGAAPLPLIVALHGRTGNGESMAELTGFDTLAEREDVVMLYPDGLNGEWSYVRGIPGYPADLPDDVLFLERLIEKVSAETSIDSTRIYVTGFSNGGFMAERLACDAPERYAAFASVSAAGFAGMNLVCSTPHPLRLLLIHGTADSNIPWLGLTRTVQGRRIPILYAISDTLAFWSSYIGCGTDIASKKLLPKSENPTTNVQWLNFEGCPEGSALELYAVSKGGHTWPGRPGTMPEALAGVTSTELEATEAIWTFFSGTSHNYLATRLDREH